MAVDLATSCQRLRFQNGHSPDSIRWVDEMHAEPVHFPAVNTAPKCAGSTE